ncbi:MAG: dTMP kinase, partial [Sedimentisphaerales bacterium]
VLCDRFISSTCAYQGSSGYPVDKIIELGRFAVEDVWPDLTVIIDIPVEEGLGRAGRKPRQKTKVSRADSNQSYLFNNAVVDRFDSRPLRYHTRVRRGFLKLAHYYPGIVRTVDGSQGDIKTVHERILQVISEVSFT